MTFEEFFKKKRIDLAALQSGQPALYSEFEKHFNQMGEKSFDHTKKYWFNKLRQTYHLAPELKPEKVRIENQLAEQTIVESILEEKMPAPSVGFKPKFKPGMGSKPPETASDGKDPASKDSATATPEVNEASATGDKNPLFVQEQAAMQAEANSMPRTTGSDVEKAEPSAPKPGFKPRFNMKMAKGDAPQTKAFEPEITSEKEPEKDDASAADTVPKPAGFKPRFKAGVTKPAVAEAPKAEDAEAGQLKVPASGADLKEATPAMPVTEEPVSKNGPAQTDTPVETPAKPVGFKPRFNTKMVKPKPPEQEN